MSRLVSLRVVKGAMEGTALDCKERKRITVGRTKVSTLQFKDCTVSQKHAVIQMKDGRWFLIDSGSSNGTFVNGVRVEPRSPVPLSHQDFLMFGSEHEVVVEMQQSDSEVAQAEGKQVVPSSAVRSAHELTVREWVEQENARRDAAFASAIGTTIRKLESEAEVLKRGICAAAGLTFL